MKILFIGEYSNVYTELSKELEKLGHSTFCISDGDGFKNYPTDYLFKNEIRRTNSVIYKTFRQISYRLGLAGMWDFTKRWRKVRHLFTGYDIVQLVNPVALTGYGSVPNLIMLSYIKKHNKKIFLSVLGDDYYTVEWFKSCDRTSYYYRSNFFRKYIKPDTASKYSKCLFYKMLNNLCVSYSQAIIPGLSCYKHAYDWCDKICNVIPFPLSEERLGIPLEVKKNDKIIIFHGWQKGNEKRKGNDIFDRVLNKIVNKYGNRVEYNIVQSVPFNEYVNLYNRCHIYIDQLFFPEYGYNALLGMAAGKVVFSGYFDDLLTAYPFYGGEQIGVSASNDEDILFSQFCELIENPSKIEHISKNALTFVERNHLSCVVADMYLKIWKNNDKKANTHG